VIRILLKLLPLGVAGFVGTKGFDQFGDFSTTLVNRVGIQATQNEISSIITLIALEHQTGIGMPDDISSFLEENLEKPADSYKEVWEDFWNNDYLYDEWGRGCEVYSAGPDSLEDSDDDIRRRYGRY